METQPIHPSPHPRGESDLAIRANFIEKLQDSHANSRRDPPGGKIKFNRIRTQHESGVAKRVSHRRCTFEMHTNVCAYRHLPRAHSLVKCAVKLLGSSNGRCAVNSCVPEVNNTQKSSQIFTQQVRRRIRKSVKLMTEMELNFITDPDTWFIADLYLRTVRYIICAKMCIYGLRDRCNRRMIRYTNLSAEKSLPLTRKVLYEG